VGEVNDASWFSACVRLVCLIEEKGSDVVMNSVFVFRASGWDEGKARALELGRGLERSYENGEGKKVAWRLREIVSLDHLRSVDLDGAEVYSEQLRPTESLPYEATFAPEASQPTQTV